MLEFSLLASGSKGNCCVIHHESRQLVIDCGTSKRYLQMRFEEMGRSFEETEALLITHAHSDHISQIKLFEKTPTYAPERIHDNHFRAVPYQVIEAVGLKITPIPTSHDAEVSCGYILESDFEKMVYVTDTGYVRNRDKAFMMDADYYIFECNHDPQMLMRTKRPYKVKQRILSDMGHLSNADAALILSEIVGAKTKEIVLAHMSLEANSPELAHATVANKLQNNNIRIRVAPQFDVVRSGG